MSKLLWHSNSPWAPTGYGNQTGLFTPLVNEHYELAISSFYGLEGAPIRWRDIPVFPGLGNEYGLGLTEHARRWFGGSHRAGMVFSLLDVWVLDPRKMAQLDLVCWTPVDHDPVPPLVTRFFRESAAVPCAMSRFGQQKLMEAGLDALYVPHGVDVDVYKPYDRGEARKAAGVPEDAFLVGMVAANKGRPSRKGFQQAFEAFRAFRERHDNALLYLHTMTNADLSQGEDILGLVEALQIPADSLLTADQYQMMFAPLPPLEMAATVYSSMDVLLNPSMGEGFGIPVLEAQACGVPVVVTDFSAMPEVGKVGWQVDYQQYWTGQKSWQAFPDVGQIAGALEHCYSLSTEGRAHLSKMAREHALSYAAPRVFEEHMLPALEQAEERFAERRPVELVAAAKKKHEHKRSQDSDNLGKAGIDIGNVSAPGAGPWR